MKQLIAYTENGKWGYRDKNTNEILIPAKYDEINPSAEALAEKRLPVVYDDVQVKLKGKWGVRSVTNKKILPFLYDGIKSHRNVFLVKIKNKYGMVNRKGEKLTPIIYDEMDGGYYMIRVRRNDKWGALDEDGCEIVPAFFDEIQEPKMRTLVIHPYDPSTDFLKVIYNDLDCKAVCYNLSYSGLIKKIKKYDRIIMLGHGTKDGLLDLLNARFVIDLEFVYLLREKECICIWCHANEFVEKHKLHASLYTGMIISEDYEAIDNAIEGFTVEMINESNELFAKGIKNAITNDSVNGDLIFETYRGKENRIIEFNANNIFTNFYKK